jgi:hypothetical protein
MASEQPKAGDVAEVRYPFMRVEYLEPIGPRWPADEGDVRPAPSWRPGTESRTGGDPDGDGYLAADAVGVMTLTVVSVHRPGRYPTRVFYTRSFTSPAGRTFGKPRLRIATLEKFRRLARGYAHEYVVADQVVES